MSVHPRLCMQVHADVCVHASWRRSVCACSLNSKNAPAETLILYPITFLLIHPLPLHTHAHPLTLTSDGFSGAFSVRHLSDNVFMRPLRFPKGSTTHMKHTQSGKQKLRKTSPGFVHTSGFVCMCARVCESIWNGLRGVQILPLHYVCLDAHVCMHACAHPRRAYIGHGGLDLVNSLSSLSLISHFK